MKRSIFLGILLLLLAAASGASAQKQKKGGAWLFAYFHEPANQGIYFALSRDGLHYTPLNDGQPWIRPEQEGELVRDAFLTRGADHRFHLVWTWSWHVDSLGYASSPDLLHWSPQRKIEIMKDFPETNNVWAPEIYWDRPRKQWLILWASAMKSNKDRHDIWSAFSPDFEHFSKPAKFFDPGYTTIDATLFHEPGQPYRLIFKQQTKEPLTYQVRIATGPSLEGPWTNISAPINEPWSEGPSAIHIGDRYVVFYDHYRGDPTRYEAVASRDWQHWENITDEIGIPPGAKHGSFLRISEKEAQRLLARHDPPAAQNHDGTPR